MARPLNPKQLKFVERYLASVAAKKPNAAQSYIDAYGEMAPSVARACASKLLTNANVQQMLKPVAEAVQTEQVAAIVSLRDRIRAEFSKLAFVNPKRFFNPDGTAKGIHELDDDAAAALAQFEVEEEHETGADLQTRTVTRTKKFKLWDKTKALCALGDTEPGVWAGAKEQPAGGTTHVNVTVISGDERRRRIDELRSRIEVLGSRAGAGGGEARLLEVAPAEPAPDDVDVAAPETLPGPTPADHRRRD